jgi:electron transport complex protein RnfA
MTYILIFISAVFVNNIVLSQFLGICPFLGVSKKIDTALGMGAAVAFVMTISTLVTYLIQKTILDPFGLGFLQTITFILVIAFLVQLVEIIVKKISPALYQALGVFLPLISTNCTILGVAIMVIQKDMTISTLVTYLIQKSILDPFGLGFLQTITFILVIAFLVQLVEIIVKKISPALYQALGVFLPLISTNCTILGVAIMVIQKDMTLIESVIFAISTAIGFGLALVLFAGIREQLALVKLPKGMEGTPTALIVAGLLAMAFMGFSGVV